MAAIQAPPINEWQPSQLQTAAPPADEAPITVVEEIVKPVAHVPFFDSGIGKTLRAVLYVSTSIALAFIAAQLTNTPDFLGPYAIGINAALVALKSVLDPHTPTLPR